jgi:acyl-CoA thioester hydrolase
MEGPGSWASANLPVETYRGVVFPWHCDSMGHMSVQHQMPLLAGAFYHRLG